MFRTMRTRGILGAMRFASRPLDTVFPSPDEDQDVSFDSDLSGWVLSTPAGTPGSSVAPTSHWVYVGGKPTPLRIEDFFADGGRVFDHTITFWDPQCLWGNDALGRLAVSSGGDLCTTKLQVERQAEALAVVHHRWLTTSDFQTIAMAHIQDRAGILGCELDVPLSIVESSSVAAVVLGGGKDRDVEQRLVAFCRLAAWRGPVLHTIQLRGKPRARSRTRSLAWPRSIRTRSIPSKPGPGPSDLLAAFHRMAPNLHLNAAPENSADDELAFDAARPASVARASPLSHHGEMNSVSSSRSDESIPAAKATDLARIHRTSGVSEPTLACARLSPGVLASLVVDPFDDRQAVPVEGDEALVDRHLGRLQMWLQQATTRGDSPPVDSVSQVMDDGILCVAQALPGQPRRFLVAFGASTQVAQRRLVWQLRVAANSA